MPHKKSLICIGAGSPYKKEGKGRQGQLTGREQNNKCSKFAGTNKKQKLADGTGSRIACPDSGAYRDTVVPTKGTG